MKVFFIFILFCFSSFCFAQNDNSFREGFTLKLAVDSTNYYEQEVKKSMFFCKG